MIVAVAAGGAPDLAARSIAVRLQKPLGQPVVVENRSGANGNLAGQALAQSPADGYTLMLAPDSLVVVNPHIYREKMPFDAKSLAPVAHIIRNQFMLAVHPSVPAKTLKEFVEFARKAPKPIAYASAGNGSQHHLLMELLRARAGIEMLHVPYKGGAPAVAATVAGETLATIAGGPSWAPQVRAGKLHAIAGTAAKRWEMTPDIPVIGEVYPGYEGTVWSAVFAPGGTPAPIVGRLHSEINAVLAGEDIREIFGKSGGSMPYISTQAELADSIRRDTEKYAKVVSALKLTAEE
jgi:tripartite-type tricarboxylate transporter receptor subunit TctC